MQQFYSFIRLTFIALFFFALNTTKAQVIFDVAGNGNFGYNGNNINADTAYIGTAEGMWIDTAGNIYYAEYGNSLVRKYTKSTGLITTIAGVYSGGSGSYGGDGGPATAAGLNSPVAVAVDKAGNVYISDLGNARIRRVDAITGNITTYAGNGSQGYTGDGGPATAAEVYQPYQLAFDTAGNLYFVDANTATVRKIDKTTNVITTIAGTGVQNYYGDGGKADTAQFISPTGIAIDKNNNIFIADQANSRIRRIDGVTSIITTIGGNGTNGFQNGFAYIFQSPTNLALDSVGNVYVSDMSNNMVREIFVSTDSAITITGTGSQGYFGNHVMANTASLNGPFGIGFDKSGDIIFSDANDYKMREISFSGPSITSQPPATIYTCPGLGNKIGIGVSGSGVTYQWYVDSTGSGSNLVPVTNGAEFSGANADSLLISSIETSTLAFQCSINGGYVNSILVQDNLVPAPSLRYIGKYLRGNSICSNSSADIGFADMSIGLIKPRHGKGIPYDEDFYSWSASPGDTSTGYSTTIYVNPSVTTTYTLMVNNGACTIDTTVTVYVHTHTLEANVLPASPVCQGTTVTLYGKGGSNYQWMDTTTYAYTTNGVGFPIGKTTTYFMSGTDTYGCSYTDTLTVVVNPIPAVTANASKDSICSGNSVTLTGGGALSYSWSNGVTNGVPFIPTASGVYSLTGTDANGCSATANVAVTIMAQPPVSGMASPATVCGGDSLTLTGSGAVSYTWSGGATNGVPFVPASTTTYTVTGTSAFGCTNTSLVSVTVNPKPPVKAIAFPSAGVCQGSTVTLLGGGGVSYSWSGGANNGVAFVPPGTTTYTVTGTDANGCTATDSVRVVVDNAIIIAPTSASTLCGQNNGTASVSVSSGIPPYTYLWSTTPISTNSSVDSLAPGVYVVTVTDSAHCNSTQAISIGGSSAPVLTVATTNSNCGTRGTGSASVVVTGGTTPYHYLWNNGDTLSNDYNLRAATYIITVTDANGCSTFAPAIVNNANGPVVTITSQQNVMCYGNATGSISVTVSSGTPPYQYLWSNGATVSSITNLPAGPYQLTVMDADSCTSVRSFTITQPISLTATTSTIKADCGVADGSASISAAGGTSPFLYSWNTGATTSSISSVLAGVYFVTVTDGNGCQDSLTIPLSNKTGPSVSLTISSNAGCGSGGLLSASATGGTTPYTYKWSNGATASSISNVPAGDYFVTVTDAHGCLGTADTSISEITPPVLPLCMVTVDTASVHNLVIWDKTAATNIDHYNVYKESTTAGVYFLVTSVPYTSPATFIDTLSNPMIRSWRYKLTQVDTCGNESPQSPDHKTMHVTVNKGVGNTINLIWDGYEGLAFSTYYIYRDTMPDTYTLFDSVPNTIYTYTDVHPMNTKKTSLYHIGIDNPGSCTPLRTLAINYNSSKSNSGNITLTSVPEISDFTNCTVFPNPSSGVFTVNMTLSQNTQNLSLKVINELGQEVYEQSYSRIAGQFTRELNLSDLAKGVYFLKISSDQGNVYKKIVLQ